MLRTAVIDSSSLIYLSHLHKSKPIFHYLQSLFYTIFFPSEVIDEYVIGSVKEPHREWILQRLKPDQGFYRFCNSFDSIILNTVTGFKGIDKGEAETYAQFKKVQANLIISDDKPFTEAVRQLDSGLRVYSTLHLICWLEHANLIPEWNCLVKELHKIRPFKSKELREAYLKVAEQLGLYIPKKIVSSKCGLKRIMETQKMAS